MPVTSPDEDRYTLPDEAATEALAARFAEAVRRWHTRPAATATPLQIHLSGNLGAGKTAFVRATLRALGHQGRVRSPSYTLVEPYRIDFPDGMPALDVHHFDLYRFADAAEWIEAGFDDYLHGHVLNLIEWPERGAGVLPQADLTFTLDIAGQGRTLHARAGSVAGQNCLNDI